MCVCVYVCVYVAGFVYKLQVREKPYRQKVMTCSLKIIVQTMSLFQILHEISKDWIKFPNSLINVNSFRAKIF